MFHQKQIDDIFFYTIICPYL